MDFRAPAEMYTGRQAVEGRAHPYRRFPSLAAAVRYAVESQPAALLHTTIETAAARLAGKQIQAAYNSADYRAAVRTIDRTGG